MPPKRRMLHVQFWNNCLFSLSIDVGNFIQGWYWLLALLRSNLTSKTDSFCVIFYRFTLSFKLFLLVNPLDCGFATTYYRWIGFVNLLYSSLRICFLFWLVQVHVMLLLRFFWLWESSIRRPCFTTSSFSKRSASFIGLGYQQCLNSLSFLHYFGLFVWKDWSSFTAIHRQRPLSKNWTLITQWKWERLTVFFACYSIYNSGAA